MMVDLHQEMRIEVEEVDGGSGDSSNLYFGVAS